MIKYSYRFLLLAIIATTGLATFAASSFFGTGQTDSASNSSPAQKSHSGLGLSAPPPSQVAPTKAFNAMVKKMGDDTKATRKKEAASEIMKSEMPVSKPHDPPKGAIPQQGKPGDGEMQPYAPSPAQPQIRPATPNQSKTHSSPSAPKADPTPADNAEPFSGFGTTPSSGTGDSSASGSGNGNDSNWNIQY